MAEDIASSMFRLYLASAVLMLIGVCCGGVQRLEAQTADSLRSRFLLPVPPPAAAPLRPPAAFPGISANSPTAYGASWGDAFVGVGYQRRARYIRKHDGAVAAGFGVGSARRLIGLEVDLISFSTFRSGWGSRVAVDLKLHRLLTQSLAVAAGWESAVVRGETDGGESRYAVVSNMFGLGDADGWFPSLAISVGAGDGRFLSEQDWARDANKVNPFGSVALQVRPSTSLIADWTGQDLALAVSVAPLRRLPLVITPGVVDLTGNAGDGARFSIGAGVGIRYAPLF